MAVLSAAETVSFCHALLPFFVRETCNHGLDSADGKRRLRSRLSGSEGILGLGLGHVVKFIMIDCLLEPSVEVFRSIGFQIDSIEKQGIERSLELFSELDVRGVIFCSVLLDDETSLLSAYFELIDEFVCYDFSVKALSRETLKFTRCSKSVT
jgi:hypothetical protein